MIVSYLVNFYSFDVDVEKREYIGVVDDNIKICRLETISLEILFDFRPK